MSAVPLKLVTKKDGTSAEILAKLEELRDLFSDHSFVGFACVLMRDDGVNFVTKIANGNRALLLGMVTDLQYTIAKDGDA